VTALPRPGFERVEVPCTGRGDEDGRRAATTLQPGGECGERGSIADHHEGEVRPPLATVARPPSTVVMGMA
jgi:hypothetical protein